MSSSLCSATAKVSHKSNFGRFGKSPTNIKLEVFITIEIDIITIEIVSCAIVAQNEDTLINIYPTFYDLIRMCRRYR